MYDLAMIPMILVSPSAAVAIEAAAHIEPTSHDHGDDASATLPHGRQQRPGAGHGVKALRGGVSECLRE